MKKSDLIAALAAHTNGTKAEAGRMIDALRQIAQIEVANGRTFEIPGVVSLSVQTRAARRGRNPATGEVMDIPAKQVVKPRIPPSLMSMAG